MVLQTQGHIEVKLLSFDRTNALLANLTSGEEGMPADLQGFSLERIRRVGKSCYQRNGHLSPLFKSPSHHYMTIFSLQNYFKTSVKKRIFFGQADCKGSDRKQM